MALEIPCPKCGEHALHKSRSRSHLEVLFKKISMFRLYRCHECGWRGWMSKRRAVGKKSFFKIILFYLAVIIGATIVGIMLGNFLN